MAKNMNSIYLLFLILIVILIFYLQLHPRPLRETNLPIIIITIVGIVFLMIAIFKERFELTQMNMILFSSSLIFLSIFCGMWRAMTCKLWLENNKLYRQARLSTMAIWVLTVIIHTSMTHYEPELYYTMIIYLALSLIAQKVTLILRWKYQK